MTRARKPLGTHAALTTKQPMNSSLKAWLGDKSARVKDLAGSAFEAGSQDATTTLWVLATGTIICVLLAAGQFYHLPRVRAEREAVQVVQD